MNIRHIIKTKRKHLGITQNQLARIVGTRQATISDLETGHAQTSLDIIEKIFDALNIKIAPMYKPKHTQTFKYKHEGGYTSFELKKEHVESWCQFCRDLKEARPDEPIPNKSDYETFIKTIDDHGTEDEDHTDC